MKPILFLIFAISLLFQSCTTYVRIVTFRSNASEMDTMKLLYANDSFSIVYDFYDNSPFMKMRFFNKLDVPLFADWSKSSYAIGATTVNYTTKPTQVYTIQPHSFFEKTVEIHIPKRYIIGLPMRNSYLQKIHPPALDNGKDSFIIKETDYTRDQTPFAFLNHLVLSYTTSLTHTFQLDQSFWVSNIRSMKNNDFLGHYFDAKGKDKYTNPFWNNNCSYIFYRLRL